MIAMLVGALMTPAQWCDEVPQPTGQTVMVYGFVTLLVAGLGGTFAVSLSRRVSIWVAYALTAAAFIAVLATVAHLSSNAWGGACG